MSMLKEKLEQSGVAGLIGWNDDAADEDKLLHRAWEASLYPFRIALSPTAIKIYLTILLFLGTSFVLISISTTAFGFFYYNFIPETDLERPIYLQYGADKYPTAEIFLETNALITQQPYDVSIELHMPRDPVNLAAGNFMLDLSLYAAAPGLEASVLSIVKPDGQAPTTPLHHSRRPAIMPYTSLLSNLVSKVIHLPGHVLRFHDSDSVTLKIPMFEKVEFARGKGTIPTFATLEIQSHRSPRSLLSLGQKDALPLPQLNVYRAKLIFQVRFTGLRYIIYNHRFIAFAVFTTLFYAVSISTLAVVWALLATVFKRTNGQSATALDKSGSIKQESGQGSSNLLRTTSDYKSDETVKLKTEEDSENDIVNLRESWPGANSSSNFDVSGTTSSLSHGPLVPVEVAGGRPEDHADNEEEESDDEWQQLEKLRRKMEQDARQRHIQRQQQDSGLGTSMESENASGSGLVRRTSNKKGIGRD